MKYLLVILLIAVLVVPLLGAGCDSESIPIDGNITIEGPTPVEGIPVEGITFATPTPIESTPVGNITIIWSGEGVIELPLPPEPGEVLVIELRPGPTIVVVTPTPEPGGGEVIEVTPTIQVPFLYETEEFDLKVVVPNRLALSTPDDKKAYPVDIYIKNKQDVESLGLFDSLEISVTLEVGVNVRISLLTGVSCHVFFDTDLVIFGEKRPDVISLEWPIPGCFWGTGGLEAGDLGVYAFAVPIRPPEGDLSTLPLGTWSYLGSYNMYVVRPYSLDVLATPLSGEAVEVP